MTLRTAVIGVGHLGKQHARIHAALAHEGHSQFAGICDIDQARGNEIDPKTIKDPELREFAILYARDADDQTMVRINRYKWPKVRDQILEYKPGQLMLVEGKKPRYGVMMDRLWVIEP